jgi:hypothetical protein
MDSVARRRPLNHLETGRTPGRKSEVTMEITVNFEFVNWWAVLAATVVVFILGGFWYSPALFGRISGVVTEQGGAGRNMQAVFVVAYFFQWLAASFLAAVLGPNSTATYGLMIGLMVGLFFVTTALGITNIFDNKPLRHLFVNGGYHTVSFGIMGLIIGFWH